MSNNNQTLASRNLHVVRDNISYHITVYYHGRQTFDGGRYYPVPSISELLVDSVRVQAGICDLTVFLKLKLIWDAGLLTAVSVEKASKKA